MPSDTVSNPESNDKKMGKSSKKKQQKKEQSPVPPEAKLMSDTSGWTDETLDEVVARTSLRPGSGLRVETEPFKGLDFEAEVEGYEGEGDEDENVEQTILPEEEQFFREELGEPVSSAQAKKRTLERGLTKGQMETVVSIVAGRIMVSLGVPAGVTLRKEFETIIADAWSAHDVRLKRLEEDNLVLSNINKEMNIRFVGLTAKLGEVEKQFADLNSSIRPVLEANNRYLEALRQKLDDDDQDTASLQSAMRKTSLKIVDVSKNITTPEPALVSDVEQRVIKKKVF